jgi:hypothetical protein
MAQVEMKMPKMGESVAEATIIKWLKNEGDRLKQMSRFLKLLPIRLIQKYLQQLPEYWLKGFLMKVMLFRWEV